MMQQFDKGKMFKRWSKVDGIMAWVTITGAILVGLSSVAIGIFNSSILNKAGAHNREVAFLRIAEFVGNRIGKAGGIRDSAFLQQLIEGVRESRPGILRLSVFEITSETDSLLFSTDPQSAQKTLASMERAEIDAGRTVMQLDESSAERAWRITAPIAIDGKVVGALRGLYSVKEYDDLIRQISDLARIIGISVVALTSLSFVLLVRFKIHRPVHRLLCAMRSVEAGDLSGHVPVTGPIEIQELAAQFNRTLSARRAAWEERDRFLGEIQRFNETLQRRIVETKTELQQANLELVESRIEIERRQRFAALGELSATMAHELGNPLNALSGHLQMLAHARDTLSRQRHLAVIRSEVDRMVSIIRQMLDQTHVRLRPTPLNLNRTIHEVLSLLSPGLSRRQVTCKLDLQDDLQPVAGDPRALHGLVFNLITNAKQAMPSGGELTIRTRAESNTELPGTVIVSEGTRVNGTSVRLTISDTGSGISPEHLSRIFEPFFTTRQREGGTGLGLAICQRVVTDSGGRLAVKSEVAQGTEFTVDLPVWSEPEIGKHP
ncbi:MAG: HAMP domain-containing protein [Nitrospira sp.]|nr:HAMP domain-containing protein [Nitrospira sp.]